MTLYEFKFAAKNWRVLDTRAVELSINYKGVQIFGVNAIFVCALIPNFRKQNRHIV